MRPTSSDLWQIKMYLNSNLLLVEQLACIRMDIIMPDGISKSVCVCVSVCVYIPLTYDITCTYMNLLGLHLYAVAMFSWP